MSLRNLLFLSISIFILSCEKQDISPINTESTQEISVENGYLKFNNESSFCAYVDQIRNEQTNGDNSLKSTTLLQKANGFNSLADKFLRIKNNQLKSENTNDDGYFMELQKALIPAEALFHVLDTANRVKIANEIYQITEAGTFIYSIKDTAMFNQLSENFYETYLNFTEQIDSITFMYGNIKLIDTHAYVKNKNYTTDNILAEVSGDRKSTDNVIELKSFDDMIEPSYTTKYNLWNVKAGAKTLVGKGLEALFGQNSWRETEFDNDHRVKVKLFNVNYVGFANCGFKVEFERRIMVSKVVKVFGFRVGKVTLWSYWTGASAPEMVSGSDYFKGYTKYDIPNLCDYYSDVNSNRNQIADNIISAAFMGYFNEPKDFVRGWVSNINIFEGRISVLGMEYKTKDAILSAFDLGYKELINFTKTAAKNGLNDQFNIRPFRKDEPIMLVTPGISENSNREYLFLSGVSKYTNCEYSSSYFGRSSSGGVSTTFGTNSFVPESYGGITPNKFVVEEAYMFGAVKYNGVWKGIRMYIE